MWRADLGLEENACVCVREAKGRSTGQWGTYPVWVGNPVSWETLFLSPLALKNTFTFFFFNELHHLVRLKGRENKPPFNWIKISYIGVGSSFF